MERSARDQRTATLERDSLMEDVDLERKRLRATIVCSSSSSSHFDLFFL
jgi:hypothetical protein